MGLVDIFGTVYNGFGSLELSTSERKCVKRKKYASYVHCPKRNRLSAIYHEMQQGKRVKLCVIFEYFSCSIMLSPSFHVISPKFGFIFGQCTLKCPTILRWNLVQFNRNGNLNVLKGQGFCRFFPLTCILVYQLLVTTFLRDIVIAIIKVATS